MRAIGLGLAATVLVVSCAQRNDGEGRSTTLTSGAVDANIDPTPYEVQPGMRLAGEVCAREALCSDVGQRGRWADEASCVRGVTPRIDAELRGWQCSPAATHARYKDCLATIREEPCSTIIDLEARASLCRGNVSCSD